MSWPTMQLCPQCEVLRGRAKCRGYENKGTGVSKNYMITWRNTHITEVAEISQYASLNRLLSARTIKRRSSRWRSHIPQNDIIWTSCPWQTFYWNLMVMIALQQNLCIYQKDIFHFVVCVDSDVLALRCLDTAIMTNRPWLSMSACSA